MASALAAVGAVAWAGTGSLAAFSANLDAQWDFRDPARSEQRFRAALAPWSLDEPQALIIETQIARTQGLQRRFSDAHATLDAVAARLDGMPSHVRVRYLLERGRVFNTAGARERALPLFAEALSLADCADDEFYAVDAAHMLAIAAPEPEQIRWNMKALALASGARDPRARGWDASLYNNLGWNYHDRGDAATALAYWEKALLARERSGDARRIREARWTVARGLRSVGKLDDARAMQLALAMEMERAGEVDADVYEELTEIELARGDAKAARPWAAKAYAALAADPALTSDDAKRLARLSAIAAGDGATGR
jgi:tetratricopeptide (TPR) repeat protein